MAANDRVQAHRARMRARGYRLVQTWVPDVRSSAFAEEARRQSRTIAAAENLHDDQSFVEAVSVEWDE
ncbi:antitoxin MazE family protein [Glaciihabitans sp. dw_435]|uniref:antitoxin MazE family protein n=1 Tax=Glaciihabitans sp. dw_435 TaxID=2720081 RepID=UPI001BD4EB09|nr:antitoxin MazE family protein [Glaciihabitans sp. dw_435]